MRVGRFVPSSHRSVPGSFNWLQSKNFLGFKRNAVTWTRLRLLELASRLGLTYQECVELAVTLWADPSGWKACISGRQSRSNRTVSPKRPVSDQISLSKEWCLGHLLRLHVSLCASAWGSLSPALSARQPGDKCRQLGDGSRQLLRDT